MYKGGSRVTCPNLSDRGHTHVEADVGVYRRSVSVRRLPACLAFAIALAACGGKEPTAPAPATSTVSIDPDNPSLAIGTTVTLAATPRDAAGAVVPNRPVAWTTSRAEVATVNPTSGVVTAL